MNPMLRILSNRFGVGAGVGLGVGIATLNNFETTRLSELQLRADRCLQLKNELVIDLKRSSKDDIKGILEARGGELLCDMFYLDPWDNVQNRGKSIIESALEEINYNVQEEILINLLNYYVENSAQAKEINMNMLHVLARNAHSSNKVIDLLEKISLKNPEMLNQRMSLSNGYDMNPVEMAIRTSYNENLMNFMLDVHCINNKLSPEDKHKLYRHADWLSKGGISTTAQIGERLKKRISSLPEELQ